MAAGSVAHVERGVQLASLWGTDHEALGEIAVEEVGPRLAAALSRGRFPKGYPHLDLNEDGALAARSGGAAVLAVADGHNGFDAARAALEEVRQQVPALLASVPASPEAALRRCLAAATEAVTQAGSGLEEKRAGTGTALTVAVVGPARLTVGGFGDCVALVLRGARAKQVGGAAPFIGPGMHPGLGATARADLRPGDRVLVATDGVVEFLGRGWKRRLAGLARGLAPAELARAAIEAAFKGGAGDNIAVVVLEG